MSDLFEDLIIFEMANSHQGSVEHGINIIREMGKIVRKYKIKGAVKLQYRELNSFIHPDFKGKTDIKHIPRFESTRLSYEQFCQLVEAVKAEGMVTMSTPFDEIGVGWCLDQGLDIIKIASCSCMDWPLLEEAAKSKKPLIISVGGKTICDIDKIYNFMIHRNVDFAFCHCIAEYPAPMDRLQLDFINKLQKRYRGIVIGYSGHENPDDTIIPSMAIAKGATIMERHVGLPTDSIKLNAYSMTPKQADNWVSAIVSARSICRLKKEDRFVSQEEIESLQSLSRGVYATGNIKQGQAISQSDVFFAMPCQDNQLNSSLFKEGMIATKDYKKNEPLYENRELTDINLMRSVIHDAKGILLEAGVVVGDNFEVELSHHFGMKHFRKTGAIIISVINREYCKKLIVVLPGQKHPRHMHKTKEETFQILYGDLECEVNGKVKNLVAGDVQTVMRGEMHSFSSIGGAVFEEVSTTHIKGDSYYEDPQIAKLDFVERKTIIKDW